MTLRAAVAGEITLDEALTAKHRLDGREVCLGGDIPYVDKMPEFLQSLLSRSLTIYMRAERLEQQLLAGERPAHPLDKLRQRLEG
jgi:regulator of CtrA degradation